MTGDAPSTPFVSSTKPDEWSELIGAWEQAERDQGSGGAYFPALRQIAVLYERHEANWSDWLAEHGIPKTRVKRPFHGLVKYLASHNFNHDAEGWHPVDRFRDIVTSKGWVSRLASVLDEWNEIARHQVATEDDDDTGPVRGWRIQGWIGGNYGIDAICEERRARLAAEKPDKPNREPPVKLSREERERVYHNVLTNPAQPVLPIPEPFAGYDGEYVLAVKLDGATGEMTIRSMWKPDTDFWLRNAAKMITPTPPTLPDVAQDRSPPRIELSHPPQPKREPVVRVGKYCALSTGCQYPRLCRNEGGCREANVFSMAEGLA